MSTETLSWSEFLQETKEFLKISERLNDSWSLVTEKNDEPPNTFLCFKQKKNFKLSNDNSSENIVEDLIQLEYHVIYSISYQVPVLYFKANRFDGSLLDLEASWHLFRDFHTFERPDMLNILTQMDHPILFRPYLALHPCRTAELLAQFEGSKSHNRVLTFISLMGPYVGLNLRNEYGKLKE